MLIERTFDTELVRSILSNKKLFRVSGGFPLEAYDPEYQKDIYYLLVMIDDYPAGVIVFHAFNSSECYQGHVNYLPDYWGSELFQYTKESISWMFENTDCIKIVALIPDRYSVVLKHAKDSGMKQEGYLTDAVLINGSREGLTLVGVCK